MYFVTASDSFFSGWGMAHEKTNKIVVEVETYDDALLVFEKLKKRHEMKYVNIAKKRPSYDESKFYVSLYDLNSNKVWLQ